MPGRKPGSKNKVQRISNVELQRLAKKYVKGASVASLASSVGLHTSTLARKFKAAGVPLRAPGFHRGEKHPGWVGGRHFADDGYIRVWVPSDSPFASMAQKHGDASGGYCLEHRLVMARKLGRVLLPQETVHHVDGDRMNNSLENLQLRQGKHGKGAAHCCGDCGSINIIPLPLS